ncbi:MAG TPA: hypothetical protein VN540_04780 [Clostridia bacterium]|nr:hypothetical protein [Clostridia bacterium]
MALDMRALYPIALALLNPSENPGEYERARAIENCLNQNFSIIVNKIAELEAHLAAIEDALGSP